MPTELRCGGVELKFTKPLGFCIEEPKEVLSRLYSSFRIDLYREIGFPLGVIHRPSEGLAIIEGVPARGTTITGMLMDYQESLNRFKLPSPHSKESIRKELRDALSLELKDLFTRSKNYLELSSREKKGMDKKH